MKEVIKGNRDDISIVGYYPRGKAGFYHVQIRTGKWKYNPNTGKYEHHIVSRTLKATDLEKAKLEGERLLKDFRKKWNDQFGADEEALKVSKSRKAQEPSFRQAMATVIAELAQTLGEDGNTFKCYRSAGDAWLDHMGSSADLPPRLQTGPQFERITRDRAKELPTGQSCAQVFSNTRYVMKRIPGLPLACLNAIKTPKGRGGRRHVGLSFSDNDVYVMGQALPHASNTVQVLFYRSASDAQHIGDGLDLTWAEADKWLKEPGYDKRNKTGVRYYRRFWQEFGAVLARRERKPGAVYVLDDILFTGEELKEPACNTRELSTAELKKRLGSARSRAENCLQEFLESCGIKREGVSFGSFRRFTASIGIASGQPLDVLMEILGITEVDNLMIYAEPTTGQLDASHEFIHQHWLAVMRGEKPRFVTSLTQATNILEPHLDRIEQKLDTVIRRQDTLEGRLSKIVPMPRPEEEGPNNVKNAA